MVDIAHASLTGLELHEPKGADTAGLGEVYVADGAGSGSWASIGTSAFTGMIADFASPVAPSGWLELDGSVISTATYSGLFAVMSLTSSGTRTNGSPVVTSISSTATFKAGYYIFGTGISAGTTILSVDSSTQVTLSTNATSGGTSAFFVSPWVMGTGTVTLPDLTTDGRYRRSRTSATKIGDLQADQNKAHTHSVTGALTAGTLATASGGAHTHSITDPGHVHGYQRADTSANTAASNTTGADALSAQNTGESTTGISINSGGAHTHTITGIPGLGTLATVTSGSTEVRPISLVVMTCIKT
jgi:hypothetical protein